jgi:hypothetical protein
MQFPRFYSMDNPKALKAQGYGWLNAINYMAPASSAGVGNLCPHASPGCIALCLGRESGQAAMISRVTGTNNVRESRARKARYFMADRTGYMREMFMHTARAVRTARKAGLKLAVRPNGSSDIAYEGLKITVDKAFARELSRISGSRITAGEHTLFSAFPRVQFLDYTKNWARFSRPLPANYNLTFSLAENNLSRALPLLAAGQNVAVIFAGVRPTEFHGFKVIDGDKHDLRFLDPRASVVGLTPKGMAAKRDLSGMVQRAA